jgi:hypothetical protein
MISIRRPRHHSSRAAGGALVGALLCVGALTACTGADAADLRDDLAAPAPQTVAYTGAPVTVTVPAGVSSVLIEATGGSGGAGASETSGACPTDPAMHPGGNGATVTGTVAVTPGQTVEIAVGGAGRTKGCAGATDSAGGWGDPDGSSPGGAGRTGYSGTQLASGGGGGATDVSLDGGFVLSAGGGGGGGGDGIDEGGDGGAAGQTPAAGHGGKGPGAGGGGRGGSNSGNPAGSGGHGGWSGGEGGGGGGGVSAGAGGGGGQVGGGGGGGGGAGSSDHNDGVATDVTVATATAPGDGSVTLTWQA